jgi:predicted double-glycine peptidase
MVLEKNPKTRPLVKRLLRLEDRISGLAFPKMKRVKQITNSHCGPAVLVALYSNLGVKASQKGIVASLRATQKIKKFGLSPKDLARASRIVGKGAFSFWRKANGKISDLDAVVNKYKYPVAVEWQGVFYEEEDEDNGHYCVITRVDKKAGTLRLADPYSHFAGVDRKFEIKVFQGRWWDKNEIKGRTLVDRRVMFLITPKGESWPKKLGMTRV